MKLNTLLQVRKVLGAHVNEPLPTILAYKILKFMKGTDVEGEFYNDKLREIIEKYGARDDAGNIVRNGDSVSISPEFLDECNKEIAELGDTEIEIPQIRFSIGELVPIKFSVSELFSLDEIITEEG